MIPSNVRFLALRALVFALFVSGVAGCATNPVTGKRELALIPEGQEIAMGTEHYLPTQQSQGGIYTVDPALTNYVNEVGQRLAAVSDRPLPYEFVVLNNSVPNAWALPGGKIAVNRGLLTELSSEAELAAVLGHEVVHAAAKHSANAMQRGMLLQGLLLASVIASSDSEYANFIVGGAQIGAQLISQKYGRDAELESDLYGIEYMKRAGYDPAAAVNLQQTFVRLSEGRQTNWLEGLFSSHPPSQERVDANRQTVAQLGAGGETGEARFKERMSYLQQKQPAYDAFDESMATAIKGDLPAALAQINRAIALEPKEPRFYGMRGDILLAQNKFAPATKEFDKALSLDDGYFEYYLGRGMANLKLGNTARARTDLEASNRLLPTAIASNELGQLLLARGDRAGAKAYFEMAMGGSGPVGQSASNAYARLDIADNPNKYVEARAAMSEERELLAVLKNHTNATITNVQVAFEATINGKRAARMVNIGSIGPGQQGNLSSGWKFAETDIVSDVRVQTVAARVD